MYTISIREEGDESVKWILKNVQPNQSLLEVCLSHDIEISHQCGGVCYCTTCQVYIERGMMFLEEPSRREQDFMKKALNPKPHSRLSCQSLLREDEGELEFTIPKKKG